MQAQLFQIPGKLQTLANSLCADKTIKEYVSNVVSDSNASISSFKNMMQHEYSALTIQRDLLRNTPNASDVNVLALQTSSENMKKAVNLFLGNIEHAQKRANSYLERCRQEAKNKQARVVFLHSEQEKMEKEIPKLESDISMLEREATQYDKQAEEMYSRARAIDREAENRNSWGIGGLFLAGTSLLLAPFTLGGSLLLTTASGIFAGLSFASAADCRTAAERARFAASDKRAEEKRISSKKQDVEKKLESTKQEIVQLGKEKDMLDRDEKTLSEIIGEMLKLLTVAQDLNKAFMDENSSVEDAHRNSKSFNLSRRAFKDKPEQLAKHFEMLQNKWEETRAVLQRYGIIS